MTARKKNPAAADGGLRSPEDLAEMRRSLEQKLRDFIADPRHCPRRVCRRAQRCQPSDGECQSLPPPGPPMTLQEQAAVSRDLKRALEQRLAKMAAERAALPSRRGGHPLAESGKPRASR